MVSARTHHQAEGPHLTRNLLALPHRGRSSSRHKLLLSEEGGELLGWAALELLSGQGVLTQLRTLAPSAGRCDQLVLTPVCQLPPSAAECLKVAGLEVLHSQGDPR